MPADGGGYWLIVRKCESAKVVNRYWLLVIGYWLLVNRYSLFVIRYSLFVIGYSLLVIGYWLVIFFACSTTFRYASESLSCEL